MQGNSRINTLPKDFDKEKILDIAALARQRQEIIKLKEQSARISQEIGERQMEMKKQQTEFNEEKKILEQKVEADEKAQQEQTTNMINASMLKAEQDRKAMMQENLDMIKRLEEMQQSCNHELKTCISELQRRQEQVKKESKEVSNEEYLKRKAMEIAGCALGVVLAGMISQKRCTVM